MPVEGRALPTNGGKQARTNNKMLQKHNENNQNATQIFERVATKWFHMHVGRAEMLIIITYSRFWQNPLGNHMLRKIALRRFSLGTCVIISTPLSHRKELRFAWRTSLIFSISKFAACLIVLLPRLLIQFGGWPLGRFIPRRSWSVLS